MGKGTACIPGKYIHYTKINLESIKYLKQLIELLFTTVAGNQSLIVLLKKINLHNILEQFEMVSLVDVDEKVHKLEKSQLK